MAGDQGTHGPRRAGCLRFLTHHNEDEQTAIRVTSTERGVWVSKLTTAPRPS